MSAVGAEKKEKRFVMKHVFKNVSCYEEDPSKVPTTISLTRGKTHYGPEEEHFGAIWDLQMSEGEPGSPPYFILHCCKNARHHWSVDSEVTVKILKNDGTWKMSTRDSHISNMMTRSVVYLPDSALSDCSVDGRLSIEVEVKIKKLSIYGVPWLRNFEDDVAREFSDVVLVAGTQEFYVNKMYLSMHSTYFKSLLSSRKIAESSKKSIIKLKNVHPQDFQHFLEVLYGEPTIWDYSVEKTLELADMYKTKTVIRRCEEFLLEKSSISRKQKFALAVRYEMESLKRKCTDDAKTTAEIRELAPENAEDFGPNVWKELFLKACSSK